MITVNATPVAGAVLLDANDTFISLTSSNGVGHYFRAEISIDDELFDVQSWSREDNYTTTVNLKQLYQKNFEAPFVANFTAGITEPINLKKKVTITVKEYLISNDTLAQYVNLPEFYIQYNQHPIAFDSTTPLAIINPKSTYKLIPDNGKMVCAFFANAVSQTITATLRDSSNTIIDVQTVASGTYKKMLVYRYNLALYTIPDSVLYFTLTISNGSQSISTVFKRILLPAYPVKELAYLTDFGVWQYAYFSGLLNVDANADAVTYQDQNDFKRTTEVNMNLAISLSTGALRSNERTIADEVIQALDTRFFYNNQWREVAGETKKVQQYRDRVFNYGESFTFSLKATPPVANQNMMAIAPASSAGMALLFINSATGSNGDITIDFSKLSGYNPTAVTVLVYSGSTLVSSETGSPTSPRVISGFVPGTYTVYLQEIETGNLSNGVTVVMTDDVPVASSSAMARLTITNVVENDGVITLSFTKDSGYNPTQVNIVIIRDSDSTVVSNFNAPASSPRMFLAGAPDFYTAYLREIETGNMSLGFPFEVV